MSLRAKATMRLTTTGREHQVELRPHAEGHRVLLELHRDDCYEGPFVRLSLDDARLFLRQWQGAVDEAFRREKEAFRAAARELAP